MRLAYFEAHREGKKEERVEGGKGGERKGRREERKERGKGGERKWMSEERMEGRKRRREEREKGGKGGGRKREKWRKGRESMEGGPLTTCSCQTYM